MRPHHVTRELADLRESAGFSKTAFAKRLGYKGVSSYQRYEDPNLFTKENLPLDLVKKMAPILIGRGNPPITASDVYSLAGFADLDIIIAKGVDDEIHSHFKTQSNHADAQNLPQTPPILPQRETLPRDVEVRGTAAGSLGEGAFQLEATIIDYVRRPPGIAQATDVYAIYVTGESMAPRYAPGELVYVSERRPVRVGDYVVVQVQNGPDMPVQAYIKRLLKRSDDILKLEQHNPQATIDVQANTVLAVHRVLTMNELFGV